VPETFWDYLVRVTDNAAGAEIARIAQVDAGTVSRWKTGKVRPSVESVIAIARNWRRPAVEALVAANYLDATDAAEAIEIGRSASDLADDELLAEIRRRMKGAAHALSTTDAPAPGAQTQTGQAEEVPSSDDPEVDPLAGLGREFGPDKIEDSDDGDEQVG
jgi:transcriptional regulator with XRE-family HTH domain